MTSAEQINSAFTALVVVGGLAAVGGATALVFSARALAQNEAATYYQKEMSGPLGSGGPVADAQFGAWLSIAVLSLGVLMLLAALLIRASRSSGA